MTVSYLLNYVTGPEQSRKLNEQDPKSRLRELWQLINPYLYQIPFYVDASLCCWDQSTTDLNVSTLPSKREERNSASGVPVVYDDRELIRSSSLGFQ